MHRNIFAFTWRRSRRSRWILHVWTSRRHRTTKQEGVRQNTAIPPRTPPGPYLEWPGLSAGRPTAPPAVRTSSPGRWEATCQLSCDQNPEGKQKPAVQTVLSWDQCYYRLPCKASDRLNSGGGVPFSSWFFWPAVADQHSASQRLPFRGKRKLKL